MSIYSATRAGVTGLNANAGAMAVISDNIANLNANYYKRGQTDDFNTVLNAQDKTSAIDVRREVGDRVDFTHDMSRARIVGGTQRGLRAALRFGNKGPRPGRVLPTVAIRLGRAHHLTAHRTPAVTLQMQPHFLTYARY
ncbi:MAG: flagellar basal body protein [Alphaproteobacteria bacterium]